MNPLLRLITKAYGVRGLIDCERTEGDWLLLAAGTGLMMSVLDQEPRFRYAIDTDLLTPDDMARFRRWLPGAETIVSRICAVGWFSKPANGQPLADALRGLRRRPLVYFGACPEPAMYAHCERVDTLGAFFAALRAAPRASAA